MQDTNLVVIGGNMGRDIEVKYGPSGKAIANTSIASTYSYKDAAGDWQNKTTWVELTFFDPLASRLEQWGAMKGDKMIVQGKLREDQWEDKEGNKRRKVYVIVDTVLAVVQKGDSSTAKGKPAKGSKDEDTPF